MDEEGLLEQRMVLGSILAHMRLTQWDLARKLGYRGSAAVNKWLTTPRQISPASQGKIEEVLRLPGGFLSRPWPDVKSLKLALGELSGRDLMQGVGWQGTPHSEDLMAAAHHLERMGHAWLNEKKITTGNECLRAAGIVRNACFELLAASVSKEEARALAEAILGVRIVEPGTESTAAGSPSEQNAPARRRRNSKP